MSWPRKRRTAEPHTNKPGVTRVAPGTDQRTETMRGKVNFQRRHYEFIARVIKSTQGIHGAVNREVAEAFADALAGTNDNFDRERFIKACVGD